MKNNIILIGMPGAGKSTIGIVLAKILGMEFLDTDIIIQKSEGHLLHEIITLQGIEKFMEIENKINRDICADNTVIAPGGSVVYGKEAMEHFAETGVVIYLKLSFNEIEQRLSCLKDRGIVLKDNQTLRELYDERIPLYEKYAHIIIEEDGLSLEQTIQALLAHLKNI